MREVRVIGQSFRKFYMGVEDENSIDVDCRMEWEMPKRLVSNRTSNEMKVSYHNEVELEEVVKPKLMLNYEKRWIYVWECVGITHSLNWKGDRIVGHYRIASAFTIPSKSDFWYMWLLTGCGPEDMTEEMLWEKLYVFNRKGREPFMALQDLISNDWSMEIDLMNPEIKSEDMEKIQAAWAVNHHLYWEALQTSEDSVSIRIYTQPGIDVSNRAHDITKEWGNVSRALCKGEIPAAWADEIIQHIIGGK